MSDNPTDGAETSGASPTPLVPFLPSWDSIGLKTHFDKRYKRDHECFKNIFRKTIINQEWYQKLSKSLLSSRRGLLWWSALAKFKGEVEFTKKICVVDTNYFMTSLNGDKTKIHTCFHIHPYSRYECKQRPKDKGMLKLSLETWVEGLQESGRYKNVPKIKDYHGL